jgi:hypothetical protein
MTIHVLRLESGEENACSLGDPCVSLMDNNTPQGYARKRTLKPGGYFLPGKGLQ